jgi:hypothetical protein
MCYIDGQKNKYSVWTIESKLLYIEEECAMIRRSMVTIFRSKEAGQIAMSDPSLKDLSR